MVTKLDAMRLELRRIYTHLFRLQGMSEAEVTKAVERRLADVHIGPKTLQKAMGRLAEMHKAKGSKIPKTMGQHMQELQRRAAHRK